MKELNQTQKLLFVSASVALLVWGLTGFLYWKIISQASTVEALYVEADKDIKKDQSQRLVRAIIQEHKESLEEVDSYFVNKAGVVSFIDSLEDSGQSVGVEVSINSVSTEVEKDIPGNFLETLNIRLEVSGKWSDVISFLRQLENLPYHIRIEGVSLGLSAAADKVLFISPSETSRVRGEDEKWKGTFEIKVSQLK
jgi:Tfp pilus assembly protein PilO